MCTRVYSVGGHSPQVYKTDPKGLGLYWAGINADNAEGFYTNHNKVTDVISST